MTTHSNDDDDESTAYLAPANMLEDKRYDPATMLEASDWEKTSVNNLEVALEQLDQRSRDILQQRWLEDDSKSTLHDLAAQYNVSAERIRQLEKNAMKKLKAIMEA